MLLIANERGNASKDSLKNRRIRSMYQYNNLQQWLCYSGTLLEYKETMPLAYHVCKIFYMRNVDSLSNGTKIWVRIIAVWCSAQKHEWNQRDWQYFESTNASTNFMRTRSLKSIRWTIYNKIPHSGLQRRARHALAYDELLQMGSYGTYGFVSSTKYI